MRMLIAVSIVVLAVAGGPATVLASAQAAEEVSPVVKDLRGIEWMWDAAIYTTRISGDYLKMETEAEIRDRARKAAEKAAAAGANTVVVSSYAGGGNFSWQNVDKFDRLEKIFKFFVDEFHKKNLKVIFHYWTSGVYLASIEKGITYKGKRISADWLQIDARTMAPTFWEHKGKLGRFCHNNPEYRKIMIEHALWLAAAGFDGLMIDDISHSRYYCACPSCRKKFKEYSGTEIPLPAKKHPEFWYNFGNPLWRKWIKFRFKGMSDAHADIEAALRKNGYRMTHFTCCSGCSYCWTAQVGSCTYEDLIRGCNVVWHECFGLHQDNWGRPAVEVKLFSAVANRHRCPSLAMVYRTKTADKFFRWAFCGSLATILHPGGGGPDTRGWKKGMPLNWNLDLFHRPRSIANIAVLFSKQTRDISPDVDNSFYVDEWAGWCQALLEANIPFDVILDDDLAEGNLAKYALLVLPNARCLSKKQVASVKKFVEGGGDMIATHETALCDQDGERLKDFSLGKMLGLKYERTISEVNVPVVVNGGHALTGGLPKVIENTEPQVLTRAKAKLSIHAELKRYFMEISRPQLFFNSPTSNKLHKRPCLCLNQYGKGRVLYFSGKPGVMYLWPRYETGYRAAYRDFLPGRRIPAYGRLMRNCVRHLIGDKLPLTAEHAAGLMINAYEIGNDKAKKKKIVIHFLRVTPAKTGGKAALSLTLRTKREYKSCRLLSPDVEKENTFGIVKDKGVMKITIPAGDVDLFMKRCALVVVY